MCVYVLQRQWTLIFMISIFASGISSTTLERSVLPHSGGSMTNKTVATTVDYEREKMTSDVKNSSELPEHLPNGMTSLENEKENGNLTNCHLTDEAKDMLDCIVVQLDDTASNQPTANLSQEMPTVTNKTKQNTFMYNNTYPPKIFPKDKNIKSIDKADEATRKRLNLTLYTTSEEIADTSSTIAMNKKSNGKNMNATISLMNNRNNIQDTGLENNLEITAQKSKDKEGTSWGMIMLIMMLTFVVTISIIYASVMVWKRYFEYKCNNRQLLDNDSEFDANDLHHFEL
ncbi:uncharacterized protein [Linepithema humile]|uniref:uncharacterized protein isoform X2 n=1 Tax=Linepithema humile TaxID=83485 RepID=UPI0006231C50|nr:PREDICTED: uncharacterized protein LOC105673367 isoform X2 [Linepithema humile]